MLNYWIAFSWFYPSKLIVRWTEKVYLQLLAPLKVSHRDWLCSRWFQGFTHVPWILWCVPASWHPSPVFLLGDSQGQRSLVGCRLWGRTESDMTEEVQQRLQQQLAYNCLFLHFFAWRLSFLQPQWRKVCSINIWQARISKNYPPLEIALKSTTLGIWCINTPTHSLLEMVPSHVFCTISQSFLELDSRGAQQWPLNKGYCHSSLSFHPHFTCPASFLVLPLIPAKQFACTALLQVCFWETETNTSTEDMVNIGVLIGWLTDCQNATSQT